MMEELIIAQFYNTEVEDDERDKTKQLLKKLNVDYCIPDTLPGKKQIKDWAGCTSLHFAVKDGDVDLIDKLLKRDADLLKQSTKNGHTPLHEAYDNCPASISHGYSSMNVLLSKQVEVNNTSNPKSKDGVSHLHIACMVNHAEAVEFFAKAKQPLDNPINSDAEHLKGYTPLHCAIEFSSVQAAEILLRHGADLHVKNVKGASALHLLVERIIHVSPCFGGIVRREERILVMSCNGGIKGLKSIVKSVLSAIPNNEIFVDDIGLSVLHLACTLEDKTIAEGFLKKGAEVNKPVKSGSEFWPAWTPLHFAACSNIEMMMLLIENGANIFMKNLKGETALDLCAKRFSPSEVQLILSMEDELKNIVLSDHHTKLSDLLLAMNSYDQVGVFLKKLDDVNVIIPFDSPIWPGYNLLHLLTSLYENIKSRKDCKHRYYLETENPTEHYDCTENKAVLYRRRIAMCLKSACCVDMKNANGQTPIHLAFSMNSESTVQMLLSCSKEDVVDGDGLSHLHVACALGHVKAVKKYLSRGAEVNRRTRVGFDWQGEKSISVKANSTPLHIAMLSKCAGTIDCLLEGKADVCARDSVGFTPIHLAIDMDPSEAKGHAFSLLKAALNLRDSVGPAGLSLLHVAAWEDNREAVDKLLLNGAEVDRVVDANVKEPAFLRRFAGKTPLLVAVEETSNAAVESLLKAGANMFAEDLEGVSAWQHSLESISDIPIKLFYQQMLSSNSKLSRVTLLLIAWKTGNIQYAEQLLGLEPKLSVNATINDNGKFRGATLLYALVDTMTRSAANLHETLVPFVKLLVDSGADVTIEYCGRTPLHLIYEFVYASAGDQVDINEMGFLLQAADLMLKSQKSYAVNPINNDGASHFHLACARNDVETATKFLDHGVDVNALIDPFANKNAGFTPLHFAMAYRCREVIRLLLERGAEAKAEDAECNTLLHVALKKKFVDLPLFEAMISRGADVHAENTSLETPFLCLLMYGGITLESVKFFLNRDCSINLLAPSVNFLSDESILGSAMRSAPRNELLPILEILLQTSEVKEAIDCSFDVMCDIVNIRKNGGLTVDDYLYAIELLTNIGCDIDHMNNDGINTLHRAAICYNLGAINALLQLGADVNTINNKYLPCPFFDENACYESDHDDNAKTRHMNVYKAFAGHVWKMRFTGLKLKESILRRLEKVEEEYKLVDLLEQSCQDELTKAGETQIFQGLTARDFLSELGAVAEYPRMGSVRQSVVDKFFKSTVDLRREFPEFCGLLALQYRKTLRRMNLYQRAKEAIASICQVELPDLCLEAILRFFTNSEMILLVKSAKKLI